MEKFISKHLNRYKILKYLKKFKRYKQTQIHKGKWKFTCPTLKSVQAGGDVWPGFAPTQ